MYEYIRKKLEERNHHKPEILRLEDLVTEEEKIEFLKKMDNFQKVDFTKLDENLNEDMKESKFN
jgi:hypothetical protein